MVKKEDQEKVKVDPAFGPAKVPEFPEFPEPIPEGPEAKSEDQDAVVVDPDVAGDLIRIPFELVHIFIPDFEPLTDPEVEKIQVPFSRCLKKWGLGKISRDEMVLAFWLSVFISKRLKSLKKRKKTIDEKLSFFGGREEGDRKNDSMPGSGPKV